MLSAYGAGTDSFATDTAGPDARYTYDSRGYLASIVTDTTTYAFTYTDYGQQKTVKANGTTLATYT